MKKLSTSISTTREQSERLLAMGMKPETADMQHYQNAQSKWMLYANHGEDDSLGWTQYRTPAWSLSRLISMLPSFISGMKSGREPHHPELIKSKQGYVLSIRRRTADCLVGTHIEKYPIECCVSMIDWLIKNNHFNEEYLKGGKP